MKLTKAQGCLGTVLLFCLIVSIQNFQTNPIYFFLVLIVIATYFIASYFTGKAAIKKRLAQFEQQAVILDELVKRDFKVEEVAFAKQKDEVLVYHLPSVALAEYQSTGSTYSGGYAGVSFRVAKGVRLNTGGTSGTSTRNPETEQVLDTGSMTATNQRIIFTGANQVRVFDLDKLVNMESGPNGFRVSIAVSNRQKTSTLQSGNLNDLTPGMVADLVTAWHEGGQKKAIEAANNLAAQLRQVVAEERAKEAK